MASRRLSADEAALWARVMAGVRPLVAAAPSEKSDPQPVGSSTVETSVRPGPGPVLLRKSASAPGPKRTDVGKPVASPANTLDGTWDRQLARGLAAPDRTIDLHGHTLASAHALLDGALDQAIRGGDRIVLLITGKPPRPTSERPHARGAIRAAVGDWLAGSRHGDAIAAVRPAHPRHGGAGALYIILRKSRPA